MTFILFTLTPVYGPGIGTLNMDPCAFSPWYSPAYHSSGYRSVAGPLVCVCR